MTRFVYFIQGVDGGLIKIGSANNVTARVKSIQACSPIKLRVLASVEGTLYGEHWLHGQLANHRAHGEWFEPHPNVYTAMANAQAGKIILTIEREMPAHTILTIEQDCGIIKAVGLKKLAGALGLKPRDISEWCHFGIPKMYRATVSQFYHEECRP